MPTVELWVCGALVALILVNTLLSIRERASMRREFDQERLRLQNAIIAKDTREFSLLQRATGPPDDRRRSVKDFVEAIVKDKDEKKDRTTEHDDGEGVSVV
jgi:hypothetical protein